jgi:hypothetical protein
MIKLFVRDGEIQAGNPLAGVRPCEKAAWETAGCVLGNLIPSPENAARALDTEVDDPLVGGDSGGPRNGAVGGAEPGLNRGGEFSFLERPRSRW